MCAALDRAAVESADWSGGIGGERDGHRHSEAPVSSVIEKVAQSVLRRVLSAPLALDVRQGLCNVAETRCLEDIDDVGEARRDGRIERRRI